MRVYFDNAGRVIFTLSGSYAPPGDYIEVEDVGEDDLGDLTEWQVVEGQLVRPADLEERRLVAARAVAEIDKSDLLLVLMELKILSPEEVDDASAGTIPVTFEAMMASWPTEARIAARVKWRADARISRTNPVIMAAGYALGVPDEVMDWIFVV